MHESLLATMRAELFLALPCVTLRYPLCTFVVELVTLPPLSVFPKVDNVGRLARATTAAYLAKADAVINTNSPCSWTFDTWR